MEFFAYADVAATRETILKKVTPDTLAQLCAEIEAVAETEELGRVVYFLQWGRFHLKYDAIMGGVRFWVPDCPNALAWTVTTGYPPFPDKIVLHATINRTAHDEEFIAATQDLLTSLKEGLERMDAGPADRPGATAPGLGDLRNKG